MDAVGAVGDVPGHWQQHQPGQLPDEGYKADLRGVAAKGHDVLGVDSAPLAVKKARAKAKERASRAQFAVHEALDLPSLGRKFDTAIDSGFFHTLSDEEREMFVRSLAGVLRHGGRYLMLCFSDSEPDDGGPRRVSQAEIREIFRNGWHVDWIRESRFEAESYGVLQPDGGEVETAQPIHGRA